MYNINKRALDIRKMFGEIADMNSPYAGTLDLVVREEKIFCILAESVSQTQANFMVQEISMSFFQDTKNMLLSQAKLMQNFIDTYSSYGPEFKIIEGQRMAYQNMLNSINGLIEDVDSHIELYTQYIATNNIIKKSMKKTMREWKKNGFPDRFADSRDIQIVPDIMGNGTTPP